MYLASLAIDTSSYVLTLLLPAPDYHKGVPVTRLVNRKSYLTLDLIEV